MRARNLAAILLSLSGCSLATANRIGATTTAATLACDYGQTYASAADGPSYWGERQWEIGPAAYAIGNRPSTGAVTAYYAVATTLILWGAQKLPSAWRPAVYAAVTLGELKTVVRNERVNRSRFCGLGASVR